MIFHISHVQRLVNSREVCTEALIFMIYESSSNFFFHSLSLNCRYFRQIWILISMISYKSHFFTEINWRKKTVDKMKNIEKIMQNNNIRLHKTP